MKIIFWGFILLLFWPLHFLEAHAEQSMKLPAVSDRTPVAFEHFPTLVHAFVWRNWQLVPTKRLAEVLDTDEESVVRIGRAMGLGEPQTIPHEIRKRAYITIIRRNWHLLPYRQLLQLVDMDEGELLFVLRADDSLYIKLGSLKPKCEPLRYQAPTPEVLAHEEWIRTLMQKMFPKGPARLEEPLFHFVETLSAPLARTSAVRKSVFSPRFCSPYFSLYGDPLLEEGIDPYPDAYLDRMVASGVDSIWMHVVLYQLTPYPWEPALSADYEKRLARLKSLTKRAKTRGIGIYLYLNEPRAMPISFFEGREHLKGVVRGEYAAICTSLPEVREYLVNSVEIISREVPELAGFLTITASEYLTNCWSHGQGADCTRCSKRLASETIADVNAAILEGIQRAGSPSELIAWDWGWRDEWALDAIARLPEDVGLMSVSEWSIPISRGGVDRRVGEYSISAVGPGPRATKHWAAARERGLKTFAKIQASNSWELAAVPYIPALQNVARHAVNLRNAGVDGIMLGWSLGGYPSPNLAVIAEIGASDADDVSAHDAMTRVASERYGEAHADAVVDSWVLCSDAFSEFPFDLGVVYRAPLQVGPANLLWSQATGYASTMVGIPYDDLKGWRGPYPSGIFIDQMEKVASGFEDAHEALAKHAGEKVPAALKQELSVMRAAAIHFRSVAQQALFVETRAAHEQTPLDETREILKSIIIKERDLAIDLHAIQTRDSRIGYESSNHYFYVPLDLAEKVLNCESLLKQYP
ncbi:MAG: hypothetical protein L3K26_08025 [Candidatus Hydrogenedentes bacterium]|nr:hypothetical protein [Candidatus Hydrogenedentota bacterium]